MLWAGLALQGAGTAANAYGQSQGAKAMAREQQRQIREQEAAQERIRALSMTLQNQAGVAGQQAAADDPHLRAYLDSIRSMRVRTQPGASPAMRATADTMNMDPVAMSAIRRSVLAGPARANMAVTEAQQNVANQQDWERYFANSLRALYDQAMQAAALRGGSAREAGNAMTTIGYGMAQRGMDGTDVGQQPTTDPNWAAPTRRAVVDPMRRPYQGPFR